MKNEVNYFDGINNTKLFYQTWTPEEKPLSDLKDWVNKHN